MVTEINQVRLVKENRDELSEMKEPYLSSESVLEIDDLTDLTPSYRE